MKEEDIRLIKQEIKNNRIAGECGLASNNEKFEWTKTADALERLLDYITNLQEEKDKYKLRCYKAKKMIFDNYGVLDKYEIEMLEDILDGRSDE